MIPRESRYATNLPVFPSNQFSRAGKIRGLTVIHFLSVFEMSWGCGSSSSKPPQLRLTDGRVSLNPPSSAFRVKKKEDPLNAVTTIPLVPRVDLLMIAVGIDAFI